MCTTHSLFFFNIFFKRSKIVKVISQVASLDVKSICSKLPQKLLRTEKFSDNIETQRRRVVEVFNLKI